MNDKLSFLKPGEVLNDLLGLSSFSIIQHPEKFNFSLDSTLISNFVTLNKNIKNIIDLGTGNAPIPLFLSLRTTAKIDAIEIQEESYDIACRNIIINNLESQISVKNADLKGIHKLLPHKYDLVITNPPFFKYTENSNINKNAYLTIARHEVLATLENIICESSKLLKYGGTFAMVHRPDRLEEIFFLLDKYKLSPKRLRFVYPKPGKEANTILIEAKNTTSKGGLRILPPLYIYENGVYTSEVAKMFDNNNDIPLILKPKK